MADLEPLKPSNTGWLVADVVRDTFAFSWARTDVDPALLALLADPQWQPYLVFPQPLVQGGRVVTMPEASANKRPLFILLDATWSEASKMFRKSPYLDHLPVLSLQSDQLSHYKLRRSQQDQHFCTSEVAALCLAHSGDTLAAQTLSAYLDVFTHHYLLAKQQLPVDLQTDAHQTLRDVQLTQIKQALVVFTAVPSTSDNHPTMNQDPAQPSHKFPASEPKKVSLCEPCQGIQRNWRRAPGHAELEQGSNRQVDARQDRHSQHKSQLVTITSYSCARCGTVWDYENNKANQRAGWSVVER